MRAPIGLKISSRRRALGVSQAALARRAGISASYLNLIERNKRHVGGSLLIRLAAELKIEVGELSGDSEHRLIAELEEALVDMHVVSGGRFHKGFYAYRSLAWAVPLAWPLIPLLYVPGVPAIGQGIYRHIAGRRLTQGCAI